MSLSRRQNAEAFGDGITIVQIVGDDNRVELGHPHLKLTRFLARRQLTGDLQRLSPYARSTKLRGREAEWAGLQSFLSDAQPIRARVLTGGGGSGKTRLALELCEVMAADGRWDSGFIAGSELRRFIGVQNLSAWGWRKPTLIVVDYAAQHAQLLSQWFDELSDRPAPPTQPLRLLLLERSASVESGWWTTVFASGGWGAIGKRAFLDPPEPVEVAPLVKVEDRLALLSDMVMQANEGKMPEWLLQDTTLRDRLMKISSGGDPLFLMMAALEMVRVGHAKALTLGRTDLATALANREASRLHELAKAHSLSPELVRHLTACVTLAQGMRRQEFEAFAASEKQAIGRSTGGDVAELADLLQQALPGRDGIAPVLPDLIGEAFIVATLGQGGGGQTVLRCQAGDGPSVTQSVIRCAQDFAPKAQAPLQWLHDIAQAHWNSAPVLAELLASMPIDSVVLTDVRLMLAWRQHVLVGASGVGNAAMRAAALGALAIALGRAGEREQALDAGQQAVDLYRTLTDNRIGYFRPSLAGALNNLSIWLSNLGYRERAFQATEEAVDLYRGLATDVHRIFFPELAGSIHNLGSLLRESGKRDLAIQAAQEAVHMRRELAGNRPEIFRPDLAASLMNLANFMSAVGQWEPALSAAQEAVGIYREFAAGRPDVFASDLAMSINNLSNLLSSVGQREHALIAAREAVEIRRELDAQRSDVFGPDLAMSLSNLANRLAELGQREPALEAGQEAVARYRDLATKWPEVYAPELAGALNNLASLLGALGQREAAMLAGREAVDMRRELATQRPETFCPDLAMSLNNLASLFAALDMREPALRAGQEAVVLHRELAAKWPEAFRPHLAGSLINLANTRSALGQRAGALLAAQEAAALYRELVALGSDVRRPDLALSLNNLASRLGEQGYPDQALLAAQEAVDLYRELAAEHRDLYEPDLAMTLNNVAIWLTELGESRPALRAAQEAVDLLRNLASKLPDAFRPDLARALTNLAIRYTEPSESQLALHTGQEAVELFRELAAKLPDLFGHHLAKALVVLALRTLEVVSAELAQPLALEAVHALTPVFLRSPHVHQHLMSSVIRDYMYLCDLAGVEPETAVLSSLLPHLPPAD